MASAHKNQILAMQREIAEGDESINSFDRTIRQEGQYERMVNVPSPALELFDLTAGESVTVELYLDRMVIRPNVGDGDE